MIEKVKDVYRQLLEDDDFKSLPAEKIMDYAFQLVIANTIKSGLRGIETSVDNV